MAEIFADNGLIIYMPSNDIPSNPYWKAFMEVAVLTDSMDIFEEDTDFVVFRDEGDDILAIQMPEPIDDNGAPKESVIEKLRSICSEEELTDLIDHVTQVHSLMGEDKAALNQ